MNQRCARIGHLPQQTREVALGGQTEIWIESAGMLRRRNERESQQPYESGMLDQVTPNIVH
jgi:hypothetical protein